MDIVTGVLVAYVVPFATWAFVVLARASISFFNEEMNKAGKTD